ncbi:hypothetical protein BGW38_005637 [Lunasporangiospora selenospora]|uniref:Uncharacterized protein n=1 Tax=Lunasporangiospora selenospora TaxID=979761 RepID=A0A9P6KBE1_9FUNG|nr:hypothetical protein BGW38_005637 [Lunasporangiospora selenospora]
MEHDAFLSGSHPDQLPYMRDGHLPQRPVQGSIVGYAPLQDPQHDPALLQHGYTSPTLAHSQPGWTPAGPGSGSLSPTYGKPRTIPTGGGPESPTYTGYQQPYGGYPSPGLGPAVALASDPYRSSYAQQQKQHPLPGSSFSPYQYHATPVPYDDVNQSPYTPRYSMVSAGGHSASGQHYPMQVLHGQSSNQALNASFNQYPNQQYLQQQQQLSGGTPSSSDFEDRSQDFEMEMDSATVDGRLRQPKAQHMSKTDSVFSHQHLDSKREGRGSMDEEDENTEILAGRGIAGPGGGGGGTTGNGQSTRASRAGSLRSISRQARATNGANSDSEEEGQEKGEGRYRDPKRCWCCSKRACVYLSFVMIIVIGVTMYFVVPRAPNFSFLSVAPMGDPVVSKNSITEPFSLQIRVDSSENYLPLKLSAVEMTVWLKIDQTKIGHNNDLPSSFVIKPRQIQTISVPMTIDYTSLKIDTNADGTLQNLISACKPVDKASGVPAQGINLTFGGKLTVWGLSWIWKPQFSFNVDNVPCPVNAPELNKGSDPEPGTGSDPGSGSPPQPPATPATSNPAHPTPSAGPGGNSSGANSPTGTANGGQAPGPSVAPTPNDGAQPPAQPTPPAAAPAPGSVRAP